MPRSIIHVGGVGWNAYINSKLLVERGYCSHVAANDIYHCVCSPEWHELKSPCLDRGLLGDEFFPNFFRIAESHAARPHWFAQGPQVLVILYLYMLKRGEKRRAEILWRTLQYQRFRAVLHRTTAPEAIRLDQRALAQALATLAVAPVFHEELQAACAAELVTKKFAELAARINGLSDSSAIVPPFATDYIDAIASHDDALAAEIATLRAKGLTIATGFERYPYGADNQQAGTALARLDETV